MSDLKRYKPSKHLGMEASSDGAWVRADAAYATYREMEAYRMRFMRFQHALQTIVYHQGEGLDHVVQIARLTLRQDEAEFVATRGPKPV